ncbi:Ger(x)C family spore germination protein [Paenibacillus oryzisoli]|uniref:Ger(x)C family spore germination protein n=1 Tax=Paenibacillus oryzisoli TaxID=1850517 RepID=UPI003D2700C5
MRYTLTTCISLLLLGTLCGCWNKAELTEFGFVQAVAVDQSKDGKIELTTHFYLPSSGEASSGSRPGRKGVSIVTKGESAFDAVRDIPIHFGRKAKWDHFRVIIIGEDFAKKNEINHFLDYFMRDHEPRENVFVLIAKGKAGEVLSLKPFIESTIGQQIRRMIESGAKYNAKTSKVPLLDLANQLNSETSIAMLPYIQIDHKPELASVAGIAAIKNGLLAGTLSPEDVQSLLMILNQYKSGIIIFPCSGYSLSDIEHNESLEVMSAVGKITPRLQNNTVITQITVKLKGSIGELKCSKVRSKADGKRLEQQIQQNIEVSLKHTISKLQQEKWDLLGIGNKMYRKNPALWKQLKPNWDDFFSNSTFEFNIQVQIKNSGQDISIPFSVKK